MLPEVTEPNSSSTQVSFIECMQQYITASEAATDDGCEPD